MGFKKTLSDVGSIRQPREALVVIRRWHSQDAVTKIQEFSTITLVLIASAVAIDLLTPFNNFWMVGRTLIMIPLALSLYVLCYMASLYLHDRRMLEEDWVPIRARFSLTWRRRFGLIAAAFIVVCIMSNGFDFLYTTISAIILTAGISIIAFIRSTKREALQEELGLPDSRDYDYHEKMKQVETEQRQRRRDAKNEKKIKRMKMLKGKSAAEELREDLENEANDDT